MRTHKGRFSLAVAFVALTGAMLLAQGRTGGTPPPPPRPAGRPPPIKSPVEESGATLRRRLLPRQLPAAHRVLEQAG
jgi:hypothetical protein